MDGFWVFHPVCDLKEPSALSLFSYLCMYLCS